MFFIKSILFKLIYDFLWHYADWIINLKKYNKIIYDLYGENTIYPDIIYSKFIRYAFIDNLEEIKFFTKGKKILTLYYKQDRTQCKIKPIKDKYLLFINTRLCYSDDLFSNFYFRDVLIRFDNQSIRDKFIMEMMI